MKRCVVCGRETYHKFEEYTVCAACDVDGSFDCYIKQSIAAQQKHAPDVVESAASVSISNTSEVSASKADSTPATTQVM